MEYIKLKRRFALIGKDDESNLEVGRFWGSEIAGWLDWPNLLERRRVALLAEAASGKTEEFRHQAASHAEQGRAGFYVSIEDLADDGFANALEPPARKRFDRWHNGSSTDDGWFFLDSVDEARLNRKSLVRALRSFSGELGPALARARVYISCRVSDWQGPDDRDAIEKWLPVRDAPAFLESQDEDAGLLDPIFPSANSTTGSAPNQEPEQRQDSLVVVQLVPLDMEQRQLLAVAAGVEQPADFVIEIERNGLDALAERPGDLIDMAGYWNEHGCFGSLAEMTEHGVTRKLAERDKFRPDNAVLSPERARHGAERLAAAMTLAKSFTLHTPGHGLEPGLAPGAIDPAAVLDDWTDAERNALTRRGVFAPASYGRIRFHHRGTQEYLTASWFARLLRVGCPRAAVWDLLFAERYGIETLVPSLQPVAAWLALEYPDIRQEIVRREPLVLVRHGDPRSLPLEAKERLLLFYAERHLAGEIGDDSLDHRALWMFATPGLADAIRRSWAINDRTDFRRDLLRVIREGQIRACADIARGILLDDAADDALRPIALEAADSCGDVVGLQAAARWLLGARDLPERWFAWSFVVVLFPRHLNVDAVLDLVARSSQDFHSGLVHLWKACPDGETRERFCQGIADLCLDPPFLDEFQRVSARHHELARHLTELALAEFAVLGEAEPSSGSVRLLMAVERAGGYAPSGYKGPPLGELVPTRPTVQRRLFWADVDEIRENIEPGRDQPTTIWAIYFGGSSLWRLGTDDLNWLYLDFAARRLNEDRRLALNAILSVLESAGSLNAELPRLRALVADSSELEQDLNTFLVPRGESEVEHRYHQDRLVRQQEQEVEERAAKASWIELRYKLRLDPSVLSDPTLLADWDTGAYRLVNLAEWLSRKIKGGFTASAVGWEALADGFGRPVAEAYRDGMKTLWRLTAPERPVRTNGNQVTTKYTTMLSFAGLGIESADDPDWAKHLSSAETERAVLHACLSEQDYPNWIGSLIDLHPTITLPVMRQTFGEEWADGGKYPRFLGHFAWSSDSIPTALVSILFDTLTGFPAKTPDRLDLALRVLRRLDLDEVRRKRLLSIALRRLRAAQGADDASAVRGYLAMAFLADPDRAALEIADWLDGCSVSSKDIRAQSCLGALFDRHEPSAAMDLQRASADTLEAMVRLAYRYVRPDEDRHHDGVFRPDERYAAESARSSILDALLKRPGAEAYHAVRTLAEDPVVGSRGFRFNELAHGKAEQDAELPAWTPAEVLAFEGRYAAPAKSGEALLRLLMGVLSDIQDSLGHADATSRPLLERAANEEEVQKWLAEQLSLRANGRFHVQREPQVARGDKPDIIVSATASPFEVAVEVKHGGMDWSVRDLEGAVKRQLAENYLKPETRRQGILVVSHHGRRTWRDTNTRKRLLFHDLMSHLGEVAGALRRNRQGAIEVRAFGLDASPPLG